MKIPPDCYACGTEMPWEAVLSFEDDEGTIRYVCRNVQSCLARIEGKARVPGTESFIMGALNRLAVRVEALEKAGRLRPAVPPRRPPPPGRFSLPREPEPPAAS